MTGRWGEGPLRHPQHGHRAPQERRGTAIGVMRVLNKSDGIFTEADVNVLAIPAPRSPPPSRPTASMSRRDSPRSFSSSATSRMTSDMVTPSDRRRDLQFMLEDMFTQLHDTRRLRRQSGSRFDSVISESDLSR